MDLQGRFQLRFSPCMCWASPCPHEPLLHTQELRRPAPIQTPTPCLSAISPRLVKASLVTQPSIKKLCFMPDFIPESTFPALSFLKGQPVQSSPVTVPSDNPKGGKDLGAWGR
jgi:hypothetical protein